MKRTPKVYILCQPFTKNGKTQYDFESVKEYGEYEIVFDGISHKSPIQAIRNNGLPVEGNPLQPCIDRVSDLLEIITEDDYIVAPFGDSLAPVVLFPLIANHLDGKLNVLVYSCDRRDAMGNLSPGYVHEVLDLGFDSFYGEAE